MRQRGSHKHRAYVKGTNPVIDEAIARKPAIDDFLRQEVDEPTLFDETITRLQGLLRTEEDLEEAAA